MSLGPHLFAPILALGIAGACGNQSSETDSGWTADDKADQLGECASPSFAGGEWVHSTLVYLTTSQGDAHHGSPDTVINPGDTATVTARFAYGPFLADLEDESISAWIQTNGCEWQSLGAVRTDDLGSASLTVPSTITQAPGHYRIRFEVHGDGSDVYSEVWVTEDGQPAVIFDIDGTLTSSDSELFKNLLFGDDPEMYEAASDVAWTYAERGYQVVYITGRPVYLDGRSRHWLADNNFPQGPLKLVLKTSEILPFEGFVGAFKERTITALKVQQGLAINFAYGNATTDICAYAGASIPPASTFIIGKNGGDACEGSAATRAITSYPEHLQELPTMIP